MFGKKSKQNEQKPLIHGQTEGNPDYEYFVMFDSKVGCYKDPVTAVNSEAMIRDLESVFLNPQNALSQIVTHPEHFSVFKIGRYFKKIGLLEPITHEHVINLHDVKSMVLRKQNSTTPLIEREVLEDLQKKAFAERLQQVADKTADAAGH